jgi:hypothetical protein
MLWLKHSGVSDLYTDPQIHSHDGEGFGAGNMGHKGQALFFKTHVCNDLCRALKLTPLDKRISPGEKANRELMMDGADTTGTLAATGVTPCAFVQPYSTSY